MSLSPAQLDRFGTGSLITRVTNDVTQVSNLVGQFIRGVVRTSMLTFGSIICLFRLNVKFGSIVLCIVPFMLACLTVCVREAYEKLRFGKANGELIKTQLRFLVIFSFMNPTINALMYCGVTLILLNGSAQVAQGGATTGMIMAAITYTTQLLNGILMLVMVFQTISRGYASWKRVKELLDAAPDLRDGDFDGNTVAQGEPASPGARSSAFPLPGPCCDQRNSSSLTTRPVRWI